MATSPSSAVMRVRVSGSGWRDSSGVSHWSSATSSPTSPVSAIARFFGVWNCSQSRARAKARSRSASPSSSVVMVHDLTSFPPYKAGSESFSSLALKFSEGEGGPGLFLTRFLRDGWLLDRFEEVEDGTERGPVHDVARRHHGGPGGEVVADRREDAEARRPALVADRPDQQRVADAGRDPPVRAARQQGEGHAGGDAEAEVGQGRQDAL